MRLLEADVGQRPRVGEIFADAGHEFGAEKRGISIERFVPEGMV
jgi:hypothetical protein